MTSLTPRVVVRPGAEVGGAVEVTEAVLQTASLPRSELIVILGGESPRAFGQMQTTGACVSRPFESGLALEWSNEDLTWLLGLSLTWKHLVFLSDRAVRHAQRAPEYFTQLIGHELEHALIVEEDERLVALCSLAGHACVELHLDVQYRSLPEEVRADQAGVALARSVHGDRRFVECLRRLIARETTPSLRQHLEYVLGIVESENLDLDLGTELASFIDEHDLEDQLVRMHESPKYEDIAQHSDLDLLCALLAKHREPGSKHGA